MRHNEQPVTLEEDWLYEAITETYIPILEALEGWERDGIPYRLTMSLTPTLVAMLEDELLCHRYREHLDNLQRLADKEVWRTRDQPHVNGLARMYKEQFDRTAAAWDRYQGRLIQGFRRLQAEGGLEILGSAATHGYLPLLGAKPAMARAQIRVGCEAYRRAFGQSPKGFWLPECGYMPGHDRWLSAEGVRYTFTDGHGILHASVRPRYGVFAPILSAAGVAVFGRDGESSKQVWSADEGYPGDFDYREFYRDIGYDLDWDEIAPYMKHGLRTNTGIKYHRITGKTMDKALYDPDRARSKAYQHAANFVFNRERQVEYLHQHMDRPPIVISPYDAELFGHWWFEGPRFLDGVIRSAAKTPVLELITPGEYLAAHPVNQRAEPSQSSWGLEGYSAVWLDPANDWIYRHLERAADQMQGLVRDYAGGTADERRTLNQAARELLLAQSSDWPFIMKTGTMVSYAVRRTKSHIDNFLRCERMLRSGLLEMDWVAEREGQITLFPWLDAATAFGDDGHESHAQPMAAASTSGHL